MKAVSLWSSAEDLGSRGVREGLGRELTFACPPGWATWPMLWRIPGRCAAMCASGGEDGAACDWLSCPDEEAGPAVCCDHGAAAARQSSRSLRRGREFSMGIPVRARLRRTR